MGDIMKKEENVLALAEEMGYTGFENVDSESLSMPFLRIAQQMTASATEGDPSYIEGLKPGYFYNTATQSVYGQEIRFVMLAYFRMFNEWTQGDTGGMGDFVRNITPEEFQELKGGYTQVGANWTTGEGTIVRDSRNFFVLLPEHVNDGVMLWSLTGTGITQARRLLTKANGQMLPNGKKAPLFANVWSAKSTLVSNDLGRWFSIGSKSSTNARCEGLIPEDLHGPVVSAVRTVKDLLPQSVNLSPDAGEKSVGPTDSDETDF